MEKTPCLRDLAGENGPVVTFAYGRGGTELNTGAKTTCPVTLAEATKTFANLPLALRQPAHDAVIDYAPVDLLESIRMAYSPSFP